MPLPRIDNPAPVAVQATYDALMIVRLDMGRTSDGRLPVNIVFRPYDFANDQLYPSTDRDLHIAVWNAWAEAGRNTSFAQVMSGIVTAGNWLVQERDLLRRIGAEQDATAKQTLIDGLHSLRDAMGVAERYVAPELPPQE